jgi:hypothetical protein
LIFYFIVTNTNVGCFAKEENINYSEFWLSLSNQEVNIFIRALSNGIFYGHIDPITMYVELQISSPHNIVYGYQSKRRDEYYKYKALLPDTITELYKNENNNFIDIPNIIEKSIGKLRGLGTEELYIQKRKKESTESNNYNIDSIFWNNLDDEEKLLYMNGFEVGMIYASLNCMEEKSYGWGQSLSRLSPDQKEKYLEIKYDKLWVYQDNLEDIKDAITEIYEDPENKFISIRSIIEAISKSIKGESKDLLLETARNDLDAIFNEKKFKENQAKLQTTSELSYILKSIEKFNRIGIEKAESITNNYIEEMESIGVNNILNPIWIKNNVAGKESHDIVKTGLDIIDKYKTRNINIFNEMYEEIDNLEIKQEYKNFMKEAFKEEMPVLLDILEKKWDLDKRILVESGKILDFFINNREEWEVVNQEIMFYDKNDLIEYNSYLSNIQKFAIKQEELNKENNKRIDKYLRLMKEDIEKIYQK